MVFDEVLLLPKPCSTRKAPRRSDGRNPRGTCTTPESLRPADGKVTASSVIGVVSVRGGVATLSERRRDGRWIAGCRATHEGVMAASADATPIDAITEQKLSVIRTSPEQPERSRTPYAGLVIACFLDYCL